MTITIYPLSSLRLSPLNVRKAKPSAIDALAADISAHGLLQNLIGYEEDGKIMICAGGRRYRALKALHKAKKIAPSFEVAVDLRPIEEAHELSLAENVQREPMHPADAIIAYKALIDGGMEAEDVAARFGVSIDHVRRLLRLAGLHPKLIAAMRQGKLCVASAQSLAIGDDHARQWEAFKQYGDNPSRLRSFLTETKISCSSPLFQLVGEDVYLEAGGSITRDLFSSDNEQFADDLTLLRDLAEERLAAIAEYERAKGWGKVTASIERPENLYSLNRLYPDCKRDPTYEEERSLEALEEELGDLEYEGAEYFDGRVVAAEARHREIEERLSSHSEAQMAAATLYIYVSHNEVVHLATGNPKQERSAGQAGDVVKPDYPAKLLADLGAIRTLAVREAVAEDAEFALDLLLHTMLGQLLDQTYSFEQALDLRLADQTVEADEALFEGSKIEPISVVASHWLSVVQSEDRLGAISNLFLANKLRLLAFCVASQITSDAMASPKSDAINDVGERLELDMAQKWQPNEAFFLRLSKPVMLKLLAEHCGADAASNCSKLRKAELASVCADRLKEAGYMPPCFSLESETHEEEADHQKAA